MLSIICLIAALIVFLLAAFNVPSSRINLVALGLALFVLSDIVGKGLLN